ncbi:hypothetical protein [Streptomyces sp. ISL-100]|uniref:hypothetical protein n=1 Tax=Streptomyces sp. ISL-100 TaxID=2819173 RepID=UPI001BEC7837|nr:hypothetical protein [Streptomyces sp. ISL-100]MBT2399562.1 hypothetical protein [Streptomyces sp. ISL-100]
MTRCPKGDHDFPEEDDQSAYCPAHGVTLLWRGDPITEDDLVRDAPSRSPRRTIESEAAPSATAANP